MRLKSRTPNPDRFEVVWIPTRDLAVDESYQREFMPGWADKILANFNVDEVRPIDVVARGDAPPYWVENGQHTLHVLEAKGWKEVPCFVRNGTTTVRDEADHFIHVNSNSKPLTPVQIFKAALAAKRPAALEIQKLLDKYDLQVSRGNKGKRRVRAIKALEFVMAEYGPDNLDDVLWVITTAWNEDPDWLSQPIIKGMAAWMRNNPGVSREKLATKLSRTHPGEIVRKARFNSRGSEMVSATALEIDKAYRRRK